MAKGSDAGWLVTRLPRPQARIRLYCFHHAGAGASTFNRWPPGFSPDVEVCAVQLPGREARWQDEPVDDLGTVVTSLAGLIGVEQGLPSAFFGHSLGGLIAFELTRELRRRGSPQPVRLLVSACRAPHLPPSSPPLHQLPDEALLDQLRRFRGAPDPALEEALDSVELAQLMLPVIRADFKMAETYRPAAERPLGLPIVGFAGREDAQVPARLMEEWTRHTTAGFRLTVLPGDHLFVRSETAVLLPAIAAELAAAAADGWGGR